MHVLIKDILEIFFQLDHALRVYFTFYLTFQAFKSHQLKVVLIPEIGLITSKHLLLLPLGIIIFQNRHT